MKPANGSNHFNGCFDFFEWSAPYYETPQEVIQALKEIEYKGKKLKCINIIGFAGDIGHTNTGLLYRRITDAGIEVDYNWMTTYPHIDKVKVPWEVKVCEPIQFVFEDGSTLEILPIGDGGARISENAIPVGLCEGLNHPNFNGNHFFKEAIGLQLRSISISAEQKSTQSFNEYSLNWEKPHIETRTTYEFHMKFEDSYEIDLVQTWDSWYRVKMSRYGWDDQIPYSRCKDSVIQRNQVCIVNGRDSGGVFWIVPICSDRNKDKDLVFFDNFGMSIDEDAVFEFLSVFLNKYFVPEIQKDDFGNPNKKSFDWYGGNLYSYENMRKMLDEICEISELLSRDYNNPRLVSIKQNFSWYPYTTKHKNELSEAEINALRKNHVPVAVDFYQRFVKRMNAMMQLPGRDTMSFAGP